MIIMRSTLRTHKCLLSGAIVAAILTFFYFNMTTFDSKCDPVIPDSLTRIVLYWTSVWGRDAVSLLGSRDIHRCSSQCMVTTNRCYQKIAKSVVFHFSDISLFDVPSKGEKQAWIYYTSESPANTHLVPSLFLRLMNDKIDGVMSYRSDSQFPVPYAKVNKKSIEREWIPVPVKPKKVAWFVSNCKTASRREDFVAEMSKYIHVDIFGACGDMSCPRGNDTCNRMLEENYSFYLSLENSLCKDYVTEKLYRTLSYNVIPIVLGPSDNYSILPNGSFIDAGKFKSMAFLALYLKKVASNETLFNSFLQWKSKYEVQMLSYEDALCAPCRGDRGPERPESWSAWWFEDAQCYSWTQS